MAQPPKKNKLLGDDHPSTSYDLRYRLGYRLGSKDPQPYGDGAKMIQEITPFTYRGLAIDLEQLRQIIRCLSNLQSPCLLFEHPKSVARIDYILPMKGRWISVWAHMQIKGRLLWAGKCLQRWPPKSQHCTVLLAKLMVGVSPTRCPTVCHWWMSEVSGISIYVGITLIKCPSYLICLWKWWFSTLNCQKVYLI